MMSILQEPEDVIEVAVDMKVQELFESASYLNAKRTDNIARRYIMQNATDIELVRNRLSVILADVRGS